MGSSDICWDYSFWHGEDRCLKVGDKEKDLESEGYGRRNGETYFKSHPILCNYTQFDCDYLTAQNVEGRQYCPNCYGDARESKTFSCPCQPEERSFLCKESNTCIPDGMSLFLSTSIYILVLIYVCHFHHHPHLTLTFPQI